MSEYRDRDEYNRRKRFDDERFETGLAGGFDRQAHLSAEAQARAYAAGNYAGPSRTAAGMRQEAGRRRNDAYVEGRRQQRDSRESTRNTSHREEQTPYDRQQQRDGRDGGQRQRRRPDRDDPRQSARGNRRPATRDDGRRRPQASQEQSRRRPQASNDTRRRQDQEESRRGKSALDATRDGARRPRVAGTANQSHRPRTRANEPRARRQFDDEQRKQHAQETQARKRPEDDPPRRTPARDARSAQTDRRSPTPEVAASGRQQKAVREEARAKQKVLAQTAAETKAAGESQVADEGLSLAKRNYLTRIREFAILGFNGVLTLGLVLGLCFFLRPSISQAENRELTAFPSFSFQSFVDGDFTDGVSTWYADTYPFRDALMGINQRLKTFYGYESDTQMYGAAANADDIPTETVEEATKKDPVAPEAYDSWNLEEDIQGQIMQGLYVKDGAVYATYGFTQEAANDYVNAVNSAADKLEGTTNVYSILIPNNSGVLLDEEELAALGGSNQGQAIQYYYDSYNDKVTTVETMDTLLKHKDEYLFFRTDHHWTALAAYYIYQNFCEAKGIEPHTIDQFEEQDFSPFLGSYYQQLQLESLAANPDTVQAWIPMGTNDMVYTDINSGENIEWNVIRDVSDWDDATKYNCFVAGDEPWAEIHNPAITDGSSCVVVKESYGNAFIPWLVDHYETVYIADFRYTNVNVADFCTENNVDDLILLNNISIIGSVDVAGKIASIL